jgi:AP-3 complex subunit delta
MYGYQFSWASFQAVEVMSSAVFKQKTIGYLAASLSFTPETDVLMLTTNLIKKVLVRGMLLIVGPCFREDD